MRLIPALLVLSFSVAATTASAQSGAELFKKRCGVCHVDPAAEAQPVRMGPSLKGIVGRKAGNSDFRRYSPAMKKAGFEWDRARLSSYLEAPRSSVRGTSMAFPGLKNEAERTAIVEYLMKAGK